MKKKEINFIFENNYTYVILTDLYGWQSLDSKTIWANMKYLI